jgi:hypothetical protein
MGPMELDQPQLHLILNVIAITSATSLTLVWYLRKRDERRLIGGLNPQRDLSPHHPAILAPPPSREPSVKAPQKPVCDLRCDATPVALPAIDLDIRQYVTRRLQDWSGALSVSPRSESLTSGIPSVPERVARVSDHHELPPTRSERIIFPRRPPNPAAHRLASPIQLCHRAPFGRAPSILPQCGDSRALEFVSFERGPE